MWGPAALCTPLSVLMLVEHVARISVWGAGEVAEDIRGFYSLPAPYGPPTLGL